MVIDSGCSIGRLAMPRPREFKPSPLGLPLLRPRDIENEQLKLLIIRKQVLIFR